MRLASYRVVHCSTKPRSSAAVTPTADRWAGRGVGRLLEGRRPGWAPATTCSKQDTRAAHPPKPLPPTARLTWADQALQLVRAPLVGGQAQPLARRPHSIHLPPGRVGQALWQLVGGRSLR